MPKITPLCLTSIIVLSSILSGCGNEVVGQDDSIFLVEKNKLQDASTASKTNNPSEPVRHVCGNDSELFPTTWAGKDSEDLKDYPGRGCTEMSCDDGLSIELERKQWAHGTYRFDIEINGIPESCVAILPFSGCKEDYLNNCTSDKLRLFESGCMLPAEEHMLGPIQVLSTDIRTLKVKIMHDANVLTEKTFYPHYNKVQPNGPGCEPVCQQVPSETINF